MSDGDQLESIDDMVWIQRYVRIGYNMPSWAEDVNRAEALEVIKQIHDILEDGGLLRLVVRIPGLELFIQAKGYVYDYDHPGRLAVVSAAEDGGPNMRTLTEDETHEVISSLDAVALDRLAQAIADCGE